LFNQLPNPLLSQLLHKLLNHQLSQFLSQLRNQHSLRRLLNQLVSPILNQHLRKSSLLRQWKGYKLLYLLHQYSTLQIYQLPHAKTQRLPHSPNLHKHLDNQTQPRPRHPKPPHNSSQLKPKQPQFRDSNRQHRLHQPPSNNLPQPLVSLRFSRTSKLQPPQAPDLHSTSAQTNHSPLVGIP
jgi:hypothetical protein